MISAVGDELITLCITFLTNSEYIKNPYLKAKLVSLLYQGTWPVYHRTKGVIGDALMGAKFANDHLLHALMKFYIGKLGSLKFMILLRIIQRSNPLEHTPSFTTNSTSDMRFSRS
jgi:hypothetical protein